MASNVFLEYNALDSAVTIQCRDKFWNELSPLYQPAYDMTLELFEPLMFMQTHGIKVDLVAVEETKRDILSTVDRKQEELNVLCGRELNVNSPKDCQTYFYIEKGVPPYHNSEGRITVDDLALQRMARGTASRRGLREAKLVQEIRGLKKLHGTYLEIEFDADQRIRCSYNPRGTKFGRLSSSATIFGTGTNLQNLPQEFKKFLVADPGYVLWEVDKRQAEWVIVAYLANDASMIKVVEEGLDAHTYTASMMFVVPEDIIKREGKLLGNTTDQEYVETIRSQNPDILEYASRLPRSMSGRQAGKKSNHGLNYDEGPFQFALINEMENSEAKRIVELYHRVYPGIRQTYHESVKRQLQRDRTLCNCFGRRIRFLDAWGPDLWKSGYSALPQSTNVDALNQGMVRVYKEARWSAGPRSLDLLAQTHDSILYQVPAEWFGDDRFQLVQSYTYDAISPELEYNGRRFRIANDSKIGLNWGAWNKDANPVGMREVHTAADAAKLVREVLCPEKFQTGLAVI